MFTAADRVLAEIAAGQHSIFTLADARRAGLTHGQIDGRVRSVWSQVHEGVYRIAGAAPTWRGQLLAACWAASKPAAVSHRAAAGLYGLPDGDDAIVEITCARWLRARRHGVIVHESTRIRDSDVTVVDGIPVMRAERVVLELAGLWPFPPAVERIVQAARRKRLITLESMIEVFDDHARRGVRGVRALRTVLEEWDPNRRPTESEMETRLLQILDGAGLAGVVPQFEISDRFGNFVARVDFALPASKIAIEYDSRQEHSDEFQLARGDRRRNRIVSAGWMLLVARHRDVTSGGHELLDAIEDIAKSA